MPGGGNHALAAGSHLRAVLVGEICARVLAGENAAALRRPGHDTQAQLTRHRHQLMLYRAFDQAVLDLQGHQRRPATQIRQRLQLRHAPGRRVADAQVQHLAGTHQIIQRAHHFIRRGGEVPGVQVQQVDAVGGELAQAGFHRAHQVEPVIAAGIDVARLARHGELGRHHHTLALVGDQPAQHAFGRTVGVVHRGVDEVAATLDICIEDARGVGFIGTPAPFLAEGHRAQRQRRDAQAGAAEQAILIQRRCVLHREFLLLK